MGSMGSVLQGAIEAVTGSHVGESVVVHGGDTSAAFRLDLDDGRRLFAKTHPRPPAGFFTTEARSLTWLGETGAANVPAVVAVSDGEPNDPEQPAYLLLDWIDQGRGNSDTEAEFGRQLAALHAAGAPSFGRQDRRTTGSRALPNDPQTTWSAFYAANRLLPLAAIARDEGSLALATILKLERLAASLERFEDGEAPARLHGDLWAGNRLVDTAGRSWIIDPAAHGGHREFDLAMMRLFGGFGPGVFRSYQEQRPLRDGWQDRVALHQIAPLVVHAIKFGGSYVHAATAAIERY